MPRCVGRTGVWRVLLILAAVTLRSNLCAAASDLDMAQRYMRAAEKNDVKSQIYVAAFYYAGVGFKQSDREAFNWFMRAAEQGDSRAQVIVAALYAIGKGVAKSNTSAYRWASRAAKAKDPIISGGAKQLADLLSERMSSAEHAVASKSTEPAKPAESAPARSQVPELSANAVIDSHHKQSPAIQDSTTQSRSGDADKYFRHGQLAAQSGEYELAIADFNKVIQLAPNRAEAFNNRCWSHAVFGDNLRQALADCNRALQLRPNFVDALDSRGLVFLKLKEPDRAIADYDSVLKLNPQTVSSLYGRGIAKLQKGLVKAGNVDIEAAKMIDPEIAAKFKDYGVK
jgi:tetratricopeptide (TPR) repeat protein